ncbi:MAG TPA: choice-of-anchor Q domain-containing protein [Chitinophagaceae bacterium]
MKTLSLILISCLIIFFSCRKDSFITTSDARLSITVDTLKYDTVFTTTGSITQSFKIINDNNRKLRISSVKLMGGNSSAYKINVDGIIGPEVTDLEVEANDSVYVFVQVNLNQNTANLPFIVRDSIQVSYNGKNRLVQLEAWGQNAHFFREKEINANETWNNDLPYVILGYLYVAPNQTLTINKGCRIYVHGNAPLVIDGSLQVNGLKDTVDRVYFQGDRLDDPYKNFPASWPGIYFGTNSKDNVLNYAVLKNGYQTIAAEGPSPNANPKVRLNQCVIDNSYDFGVVAVNSSITAVNCLITNCGKNVFLAQGGSYQFTHCTVATYSNSFILHRDPVLTVSNYANNVSHDLTASFRNCIFWGENGLTENEVVVVKNGNTVFNVNFDQAIWKVKDNPQNITSAGILNDQNPVFDSIDISHRYYDFRLKAGSPAINKGVNAGIVIDLDGKPRPVGLPDLGCFEKQ